MITAAVAKTTPIQSTAVTEFGYAMIRPDGLAMGLDEPIIDRLEQAGLSIIARSISEISPEQIDALYPDLHDKPYYSAMKAGMVGQRVMSLIVSGSDVTNRMRELKGSAKNTSGSIRGDFSGGHLLSPDLHARFLAGTLNDEDRSTPEWKAVMRDDRLHTDVTEAEAANSIAVMFAPEQLQEAASRFPGLLKFIDKPGN